MNLKNIEKKIDSDLLKLSKKIYYINDIKDLKELAKNFKESNFSSLKRLIEYNFPNKSYISGKDYIIIRLLKSKIKYCYDKLEYLGLDKLTNEKKIFIFGPFEKKKKYSIPELAVLTIEDIEDRGKNIVYWTGFLNNYSNREKEMKGEAIFDILEKKKEKNKKSKEMYNSLCELLEENYKL